MAFELIDSARDRWRVVNGARLVVLVRAGVFFGCGVLFERADTVAA